MIARQDVQYSWSCMDQSEKDVNIFERGVKGECQYVVASFLSSYWLSTLENLLYFAY